jgi:integrase
MNKPLHVCRSDSVSVPIYRETRPNGSFRYRVAWQEAGRRHRRGFADEAAAKRFAAQHAQALASLGSAAITLSGDDAATYAALQRKAELFGVSLARAVGEWLEATEIVGTAGSLVEATRHWTSTVRVKVAKPVADAVAEFLAAKRESKRSARHVDDLAGRLGKFAEAFRCPLSAVTSDAVRAWLSHLGPISARSSNNYLQAISSLARYGQRQGWLPAGSHPLLDLERYSVTPSEIRILTPAEFSRVRAACRPEMLPFILLAGLCGIRHAELLRMTWGQVHITDSDPTMPHGWVEVRADQSKNAARLGRRARRLIPLCAGLAKALSPLRRDSAKPVCPFVKADNQITKLARKAGVAWSENVLRHSFGSYRLALTGDEGKVALEMGNSPAMIFAHYRSVVSAKAAAEWFACE